MLMANKGKSHKKQLVLFTGIIPLILLAFAGGCAFLSNGIKFPHAVHLVESACEDCHPSAKRADHDSCNACHNIDQKNSSTGGCKLCHDKDDQSVKASKPEEYADLKFNHPSHVQFSCTSCHVKTSKSNNAGDADLPGMNDCLACHYKNDSAPQCPFCHDAIDENKKPAAHDGGWLTMHGKKAQIDKSCFRCHGQTECIACHAIKSPKSHGPAWKNSRHGIDADRNRDACAVCHRADQCSRCHQAKPPSHSAPRFRLPTSAAQGHARLVRQRGGVRSCLICHQSNFCLECHPRGI